MAIKLLARTELARIGSFLRLISYKVEYPSLSRDDLTPAGQAGIDENWAPKTPSIQDDLIDVYRRDAVSGILHFEDESVSKDAVARHQLLTVRQFRLSTVVNARSGDPDLNRRGLFEELPAGSCEAGEPPLESFIREVKEETGLRVGADAVELIGTYYPSPGACSEQIHLYYVKLEKAPDASSIYGLNEREQIERVKRSVPEFLQMIVSGALQDSKAICAAEWMRRPANREKFGGALALSELAAGAASGGAANG